MEVNRIYFKWPAGSFFLFGPRGTGKSTLVHSLRNAICVDLLLPDVFRTYAAKPEHLLDVVAAHGGEYVIVDEIQKVPGLLSAVHALIEKKTGKKFVLTGSSARKLKRTGVDLLAGRAVVRNLPPLMASEIGSAFSLERALKIGMLPLILFAEDQSDTLRSYIALYLREEVQMEGLVRNIGNFSRFLEMMSFSHGSVLNVANVARECQVERKTVTGYLDVLRDLLLSFHVPPFTVRARREVSVHEKFYLFDAGVYKSLRPAGLMDRPEEIDGPALEGLVAQHLKAWIDYRCDDHQLFFWRTRSGVEVDFVVYGPEGLWAIEVKNSARIQPQHLSSLRSFGEDYPESKRFLVYRGKERLLKDGILCMPCDEFLRSVDPTRPLGC